jgi:hypothetical protein
MLTKFSLQTSNSRLRQSVALASASQLLARAHHRLERRRVYAMAAMAMAMAMAMAPLHHHWSYGERESDE